MYAYANQYDDHVVAAAGDTARAALDAGLVDALLTDAEIRKRLRELVGADEADDDNAYQSVAFRDYLYALCELCGGIR